MNEQSGKYLKIILSRLWLIVIITALSAGAAYYTQTNSFVPKYEAKMKMLIVISDEKQQSVNVFDSLRTSQMAVVDVSQIAGSEEILSDVAAKTGSSYKQLSNALTINAIPNSRTIETSISLGSPELALKAVQALNESLYVKLGQIQNGITYKVLNKPSVGDNPINSRESLVFTILAAFGGMVLGAIINLLLGETRANKQLYPARQLFKEENILPVPASKKLKTEGVTL